MRVVTFNIWLKLIGFRTTALDPRWTKNVVQSFSVKGLSTHITDLSGLGLSLLMVKSHCDYMGKHAGPFAKMLVQEVGSPVSRQKTQAPNRYMTNFSPARSTRKPQRVWKLLTRGKQLHSRVGGKKSSSLACLFSKRTRFSLASSSEPFAVLTTARAHGGLRLRRRLTVQTKK